VQWLLALLALRHGSPLQRSWLAATLWPDSSETRAFARLRESLKDLRRALGPEGRRLHSPSRHTLALDLMGTDVDLLGFDAAIGRRDPRALDQAIVLYRAPLLEGCAEEWAFPEREARQQAYLAALETLAVQALEGGDPSGAERHLRRAVAVDPLRESAQRELMRVLAADGNHAAATRVYQELRVRLHRELHAEPDPETSALFEEIRKVARFRGSALPSNAIGRTNVPMPRTPLLGREEEVRAVRALLMQETVGLVTLTGTPGVGKTRLALEVAAGLVEAFEGGVWFVDLAPIRDAELVLSVIATAMGVRETDTRPLRESVRRFPRSRQILLVLDNFEQLLPAASMVAELLEAAPGLKVLVTSRAALCLRGEHEMPVPPLAEEVGVRLLVTRAAEVASGFTMTEQNAPVLAGICRRLDGLPLAIELAARRMKLFSPERLLARLENRLGLLVGGPRDLPARQQTLRDTIAWSYDLLEEPEKARFRRLGIFAGGCSLDAAAIVANVADDTEIDLLNGLASLVDQSLLLWEEGTEGAPRFRMLETIREYAREQLAASGEEEATRQRHTEYFMTLAETAEPELAGGDGHAAWQARLREEHENLREALNWCVASGSAEMGLRLGAALLRFWRMWGHLAEGREFMTSLLALPGALPRTALRIQALHVAGSLALFMGDGESAWTCLTECLSISRELDDPHRIAGCLCSLGRIAHLRDEYETARPLLEESLSMRRELDDQDGIGDCLNALGGLAYRQGDYETARRYYGDCLALWRQLGLRADMFAALSNLGLVALYEDADDEARRLFSECLAIARELGNIEQASVALLYLGSIAYRDGDFATARAFL
jgi:predicted ATPase/DNA-binding SARP family transcriptional activator